MAVSDQARESLRAAGFRLRTRLYDHNGREWIRGQYGAGCQTVTLGDSSFELRAPLSALPGVLGAFGLEQQPAKPLRAKSAQLARVRASLQTAGFRRWELSSCIEDDEWTLDSPRAMVFLEGWRFELRTDLTALPAVLAALELPGQG